MFEFFRKNISLSIGLFIPVLMTILFSLAAILPKILVSNPQYDLIYMDEKNHSLPFDIQLDVKDGRLLLKLQNLQDKAITCKFPKIYLFNTTSQKSEKLIPKSLTHELLAFSPKSQKDFVLDSVILAEIDRSRQAPDNYQVQTNDHRDLFFSFFLSFSFNRERSLVISKAGRNIKIPTISYYPMFLGWLIKKE